MFSVTLAVLLVLVAAVQLWIIERFSSADDDDEKYAGWFSSIPWQPEALPRIAQTKVSVLICARNEAANLALYLPFVLEQDYRNERGEHMFELIVVDDRSDDDTKVILQQLLGIHPHLKIVSIDRSEPRRFPGKKDALCRGIEAAAHEVLLMTDADCRPATDRWISWMVFPFGRGREIVAGYGAYESAPGFLNRFIQCETIHTFVLFQDFARRGKPYMAVGRNLACRKGLLLRAQEHPLWSETASGDDDMLIQICATAGNMVVIDDPGSHTYSTAKSDWSSYLRQKQRHMTTGKLYHPETKRALAAYALSHAFCWILLICCIWEVFAGNYSFDAISLWVTSIGLVVIMRFIFFSAHLNDVATKLGTENRRLRFFWPIFDLSWMIYNIVLAPYIVWKTKQRWK